MTRTRLEKNERRDQLVGLALNLAKESSYLTVTLQEVANRAKVVKGTVVHHFKTTELLRDAIVDEAVYSAELKIIAEALANKHPRALMAPERLRREAAEYILNN